MPKTFSPARLEAFSDGVIAVIITIMVLELKVPVRNGWDGLRALMPALMVHGISFLFIGVYWVNHHLLLGRLSHSNNRILWANLIWMFVLSMIPFFTNYVVDKRLDAFSVAVYSACQLATGAAFLLLRYAVDCQLELEGRVARIDVATQGKHWISIVLYGMAVILARWMPKVALLCTVIVTLIWIVPTLGLFESGPEHEAPGSDSR